VNRIDLFKLQVAKIRILTSKTLHGNLSKRKRSMTRNVKEKWIILNIRGLKMKQA